MRVCRFYQKTVPEILSMKCGHYMAHVLSMAPLRAEEDLRFLRLITNPHMTKDMQDLPDELRVIASWGEDDGYCEDAKEFYAKIEAARNTGK